MHHLSGYLCLVISDESGHFLMLESGRVSYLWNWKISPQNPNFFHFGSKKSHWVRSKNIRIKGESAPYLLPVKSMLGSVQGQSLVLILVYIHNSVFLTVLKFPHLTGQKIKLFLFWQLFNWWNVRMFSLLFYTKKYFIDLAIWLWHFQVWSLGNPPQS